MINPNLRKLPLVDPTQAKPQRYNRSRRKTEQRKDRENRDAEYNVVADIVKEENQECAYCGQKLPPDQLQIDHICSGTAGRAATLLNPDTWNVSCSADNSEHHPIEKKILVKVLHVLGVITRGRGKQLSKEQREFVMRGVKKAKW